VVLVFKSRTEDERVLRVDCFALLLLERVIVTDTPRSVFSD
jgi:hypothetical protein